MAISRLVPVVLWLATAVAGGLRSHTLEAIKSIVPEVRSHYHSSCVLLVYSTPNNYLAPEYELKLLELKRFLAQSLIQVATTHVQEFNLSTQKLNFCPHKPPLCVLLSSDEAITQKLQRMSSSGSLAGPSWVQFLDSAVDLDSYFGAINIPFNCKYLVVRQEGDEATLTEVFFLRYPGSVQTTRYGVWSLQGGTATSRSRMYERRPGLRGIVITAATMHEPPLSILTETEDGTITLGGYLGDLWAILESRINFTTKFVRSRSHGWGNNQGGVWNGMIEMVRSGEVDLAVSDFTMTSDRMSAIAFTTPFKLTRYLMCIKTPSKDDGHWDDFLVPFVSKLWITVLGSILVYTTLLWSLHKLGVQLGNAEAFAIEDYRLKDCLLYVFSAYCQQGNDFTPRSWPCRVVYLMAYVTGLTLLAAYSAALISSLAEDKVVLPFNDLDGLLKDGTYSFSCINTSAEFSLFQNSKDPTVRKVYEKYLSGNTRTFPRNTKETIDRLCTEKDYASLLAVDDLQSTDSSVCNLVALTGDVFPASLAIAVAKNSPYRGIINKHLNSLRDIGVLEALWTQFWPDKLYLPQSPWTAVTVANIRSIVVLLAGGAALSALVAWLERCTHRPPAPRQRSADGSSYREDEGPRSAAVDRHTAALRLPADGDEVASVGPPSASSPPRGGVLPPIDHAHSQDKVLLAS